MWLVSTSSTSNWLKKRINIWDTESLCRESYICLYISRTPNSWTTFFLNICYLWNYCQLWEQKELINSNTYAFGSYIFGAPLWWLNVGQDTLAHTFTHTRVTRAWDLLNFHLTSADTDCIGLTQFYTNYEIMLTHTNSPPALDPHWIAFNPREHSRGCWSRWFDWRERRTVQTQLRTRQTASANYLLKYLRKCVINGFSNVMLQ